MVGVFDTQEGQNDTNFEEITLKIINSEGGYIRRKKLIEELQKRKIRGFSLPAINRKLRNLIKQRVVLKIPFNELEKYGIEEPHKRSVYIALEHFVELVPFIKERLKQLQKGNMTEKKEALWEIESYTIIPLTGEDINTIAGALEGADDDLTISIIRALREQLIDWKRKPKDTASFVKNVKKAFEIKNPSGSRHHNTKSHTLSILGVLDDSGVVEQLIKDAETILNPLTPRNEHGNYIPKYVARIIEKNRERLYEKELELRLAGKEDGANLIAGVRQGAKTYLGRTKSIEGEGYL